MRCTKTVKLMISRHSSQRLCNFLHECRTTPESATSRDVGVTPRLSLSRSLYHQTPLKYTSLLQLQLSIHPPLLRPTSQVPVPSRSAASCQKGATARGARAAARPRSARARSLCPGPGRYYRRHHHRRPQPGLPATEACDGNDRGSATVIRSSWPRRLRACAWHR